MPNIIMHRHLNLVHSLGYEYYFYFSNDMYIMRLSLTYVTNKS